VRLTLLFAHGTRIRPATVGVWELFALPQGRRLFLSFL
jgi:hypothetical protein